MRWIEGTPEEIVATLAADQRMEANNTKRYEQQVEAILAAVQANGDQALRDFSEKFDNCSLTELQVSETAIASAFAQVEPEVIAALEAAKANIISFHSRQKQEAFLDCDKAGVIRGQLVLPLEKVGVYVPGGTAAYPSSVLMNVLPAKIAGVDKIVMVTPPAINGVPPVILAAAKIAGVDEVYQVGGAQAIAALAYGTATIPKVDKIVGPGNIYVATAKKLVYGQVDIDMIAGPSEIGIIADQQANPAYIAADLLSQAEHDKLARAILVTNSRELGEKVEQELVRQLADLPRKVIAEAALQDFGRIILADSITDMFQVMNQVAPEHLEIQLENPLDYLHDIRNAGSVFLGAYASEPLGDYYAGTNHVLPTSGTARFYSPLSLYDFIKHTQITYYTKAALAKEKDAVMLLARKEGLEAHARAVAIRFEKEDDHA